MKDMEKKYIDLQMKMEKNNQDLKVFHFKKYLIKLMKKQKI